jgi:hypothetical protein
MPQPAIIAVFQPKFGETIRGFEPTLIEIEPALFETNPQSSSVLRRGIPLPCR